MGCSSSKSAVKSIQVSKEGVVTKSSAPAAMGPNKDAVIDSAESFVHEVTHVEVIKDASNPLKSTSAKSRDSGIDEMDLFEKPDAIDREIAEFAAPNAVHDVEQSSQDDCSLSSEEPQKVNVEVERLQSEAILKELESAGLIQASKFNKGGAAFEVNLGETGRPSLPPLAPLNRLPPRLERLKSQKRLPNKDDIDAKIKNAEKRRAAKMERRKNKIALKLARDEESVLSMEIDETPSATAYPVTHHNTRDTFNKDNVFEGSDISSLDSAPCTPGTGTPSF